MVDVRIESKPSFKIVGQKIWIGETDNELFGQFWDESNRNGLVNRLNNLHDNKQDTLLDCSVFGVSCVEKDPSNRCFYFFIATESDTFPKGEGLEEYTVPACEWAIFRNKGKLPGALVEAEMYAFMDWLPNSKYEHANAPEMELYPPYNGTDNEKITEFWLPIREKI
jgi:AraC family transcriptional regulator